jgi:hypothetical protein
MRHAREKSDSAVVAEKPSNKAGQPGAEAVERRAEAEGNAYQQSTRRAQNRESVSQALERIRQVARQRKKEKFTALFHHISIEHLREAYFAQEPGRPHAGEAQGDQGGTATADAPADSRAGEVVEASRHRFLRISRGADQRSRTLRVPLPHHGPVATHAPAAQSTRPHHVGTDHAAGRRLSPQTPRSSPLAKCALCRQAPEVGAECPNRARSDLCGERSVMGVPTAIHGNADLVARFNQLVAGHAPRATTRLSRRREAR